MRFGLLFRGLVAAAAVAALAACGGGGGGGGSASQPISGGGVKGPLANADAAAHAFDPAAAGFLGAEVATATTNGAAALVGLSLPSPGDPPYILVFTGNAGTTDLTTGLAPVVGTLRTVITQDMLDAGDPVYATLQTTMATDLAVANADSNVAPYAGDADGTVTEAEFLAALPVAAAQVASSFGFGLNTGVDLFRTPPLLNGTTDTAAEQRAVAAYRTASEALTALVFEMAAVAGVSADVMLDELTADLADGTVDGSVGGTPSGIIDAAVLAVLAQDPATLTIPNTTMTVADVQQLLADETAATGAGVDTTSLTDGTITTVPQPAEPNSDRDGDGHPNAADAFPDNAAEWADTDGDGTGDNADVCPADPANDADGDGVCGDVDVCPGGDDTLDADGDATPDFCDACPADAANDADGDSVCGDVDNCPAIANGGQADGDGDGAGDVCDPCPSDPSDSCGGSGTVTVGSVSFDTAVSDDLSAHGLNIPTGASWVFSGYTLTFTPVVTNGVPAMRAAASVAPIFEDDVAVATDGGLYDLRIRDDDDGVTIVLAEPQLILPGSPVTGQTWDSIVDPTDPGTYTVVGTNVTSPAGFTGTVHIREVHADWEWNTYWRMGDGVVQEMEPGGENQVRTDLSL